MIVIWPPQQGDYWCFQRGCLVRVCLALVSSFHLQSEQLTVVFHAVFLRVMQFKFTRQKLEMKTEQQNHSSLHFRTRVMSRFPRASAWEQSSHLGCQASRWNTKAGSPAEQNSFSESGRYYNTFLTFLLLHELSSPLKRTSWLYTKASQPVHQLHILQKNKVRKLSKIEKLVGNGLDGTE